MMVLFLTTSYTGLNVPVVAMITMLLVIMPGWGSVNIREAMKNVPWEVVFFAAVAACITSVVSSSGLGSWIADIFLNWTVGLPLFLILLVICIASGVLNGLTMTSPASLLIPSLGGSFRHHWLHCHSAGHADLLHGECLLYHPAAAGLSADLSQRLLDLRGLHQIRLGLLHPLDYTLQLDYLYRWAYDWNYVA